MWKGIKQRKTGVAMRGTHFPDEGGFPFFLPSLESFKSPYEVFGSSYGRTRLILLNLTGESLLLGKDQKAGAAAVLPAPPRLQSGLASTQGREASIQELKIREHVN